MVQLHGKDRMGPLVEKGDILTVHIKVRACEDKSANGSGIEICEVTGSNGNGRSAIQQE